MISKLPAACLLATLCLSAFDAAAGEFYGGVGTTGVELGVGSRLGGSFAGRLEANALTYTRNFSTSEVDYDAKMKFVNAGAYLDWFLGSGIRVTGGALLGSRKIHGTARSVGNTITLNSVVYPVAAGDNLDFDAKYPSVTPYVGLGYGHHREDAGLHFYADAGVAIARPKVTLTPSGSLAAKLNPADLASEQALAQDKANGLRAYPVVKLGAAYSF